MSDIQKHVGANPVGAAGTLAGRLMNVIHGRAYLNIVRHIAARTGVSLTGVLDIGCGGGIALKRLSDIFPDAALYGVDISPDMIRLAGQTNRKQVKRGRVVLNRASASALPVPAGSMDLVTAFDTINFWDDYPVAMGEIRRVLKPGGRFYIINGYPEPGTRWYDFVRFKDEGAYHGFLTEHGFLVGESIIKGHTIIIEAIN
jgi:ubiquinone/menaquinone biosynthesis C-methylase UbiE